MRNLILILALIASMASAQGIDTLWKTGTPEYDNFIGVIKGTPYQPSEAIKQAYMDTTRVGKKWFPVITLFSRSLDSTYAYQKAIFNIAYTCYEKKLGNVVGTEKIDGVPYITFKVMGIRAHMTAEQFQDYAMNSKDPVLARVYQDEALHAVRNSCALMTALCSYEGKLEFQKYFTMIESLARTLGVERIFNEEKEDLFLTNQSSLINVCHEVKANPEDFGLLK